MAHSAEFVLLLGMERYSRDFFAQVAAEVRKDVPNFRLHVFEDRDTMRKPDELEAAIARSSCVFMALIALAEHAEWLAPVIDRHAPPVVLGFEGLPETMRMTRLGGYTMAAGKGMPKPVQNVARMLVGGREEDAYYGYVKLQKLTSRLMKFLPGKRLGDFRNWTSISTYWSNRSVANIANMCRLILRDYCGYADLKVAPPVELPTMGFAHPDAPHLFARPEEYERWEQSRTAGASRGRRNRAAQHNYKATVALLSFRAHILSGTQYHNDIVRSFEAAGLRVLPIFCMGIENHVVVREWLSRMQVDVVVNTMGFPLVGGPAGSTNAGLTTSVARELLGKLDTPYIVAQPLYIQDLEQWRATGVGPLQSTFLYSLPEMDGAVAPVVLGGMQGSAIVTLPDRLDRLARLVTGFARLRRIPNAQKKVAIVVYDYPPGMGNTATAALLDVPASLVNLLRELRAAGYNVGEFPEDPATLVACLEGSIVRDEPELPPGHPPLPAPLTVNRGDYHQWLRPRDAERVAARWGDFPGDIAPAGHTAVFLGGMQLGNVYLGVQPVMGMPGDPMRLLFDRENTPHQQYLAFYRWLVAGFGADAIVHVGMHGTAEWMPGLQLGISADCWSDVLLGERPNFYVYPINNPAEANIAKRRGYSTIIGHAIPPYGRAGLYKELAALKDLLEEYRARPAPADATGMQVAPDTADEAAIMQKIALLNLDDDLARRPAEPFADFVSRVYAYLRELEQTLIVEQLHVLGAAAPSDQQLTLLTEALKIARSDQPGLADLLLSWATANARHDYAGLLQAARSGDPQAIELRAQIDTACTSLVEQAVIGGHDPQATLQAALGRTGDSHQTHDALTALVNEGRLMLAALRDNTQELDFLLRGLAGGYIPAAPGGDLIRDGLAVLPTGRNIHALDPFRIPTDAAFGRGVRIAEALLAAHRAEHDGAYPATIAQVLWGLDAIKTRGEAIGTILGLIGARPVKDGQGKIGRYELIDLAELGRPRVDVLMTASGVFRDTFAGTIDMLDALVRRAAAADEPLEQNFIRKHVQALVADGIPFEQATARIFTQAQGTYGTYVDDAVESGAWEERQELEDMFIRRNAYAFGGNQAGAARPEVLRALLGTVERVAQEIDSVEYGLTDMQHYFGYSGALKAAAERQGGRAVKLSYVESFTAETKVQDLEQVLRVEYRTKLLNPKWYEGMLRHGHNGAAEIANRFTYMLGWSATTGAVDSWVYDRAAETFVLDDELRGRLEAANPAATRNAVGRLLEANSRGIWQTDAETLDRLRELYADLEDRLEGVT